MAKLLVKLKYPIPSPKRFLGILSVAIVLEAVLAAPQPKPCIKRIIRIALINGTSEYENTDIININNPTKNTFFRPNLSRSNPEIGLIITEDTTNDPVTNPMIEFVPPSFFAYSGSVGNNI